jgi:DnaJ like chaperone protein
MSIWGRYRDALSGLLVGGPIGALVSAVAGLFLIERLEEGADPGTVFTIAVIALSAKMAKADGVVTEEEVEAFHRIFRVAPDEEANVRRVFDLARGDTAGYEVYARQIAKLFAGRPAVLEDIMDGLFEIAKADSVLHPGELEFLTRVADIFGFAPNEFRRIRATHFRDAADPYVVLGVGYDAGEDEIRRTYRMLVKENHPDSLMGRGVPEKFVLLATSKLAAINDAYAQVLEERGFVR